MLDTRDIDEIKDYRDDFDRFYDSKNIFISTVARFCLAVINFLEKIYEDRNRF